MTIPQSGDNGEEDAFAASHREFLLRLPELFSFTYILDFWKYAPVYDKAFRERFYLGGHLNPAGYYLTAKMKEAMIHDCILRNPEDFKQVAFIGKAFHNADEKW